MHGILSYARFGQQKIDTASKDKLKSYFDEIYASGERLLNLLNDLLDLAKLEAGKIEYNMSEGDLAADAEGIALEFNAFAAEKMLKIVIEGDRPAEAQFDTTRISQVLRNLLSNAIKFSHPETVIRIVFKKTTDEVICSVINHGVGIAPAELERIFDKFVQSSKTKTNAGGTGLGLAICKEIVNDHGGEIRAECDTDGATRMVFKLPIIQASALKVLNKS